MRARDRVITVGSRMLELWRLQHTSIYSSDRVAPPSKCACKCSVVLL